MRKTVKAFLTGTIIITLGFGTSVSANAAEPVSTEDVVAHAQDAVGIDASLTVRLTSDASGVVSTADGSFTIAQSEDAESLEIASTDSTTTLVIEDSDGASLETIDNMAIADSGIANSVDYAVAASEDGSLTVNNVIRTRNAPERYSYRFDGVDLIVLDDDTGQATLFMLDENSEYEAVGGIDTPWAVDARGVTVPTHFEVNGNTLIQVIEHQSGNFAYPITADPQWWDNVKAWFKRAGNGVKNRAMSAARWLGNNSRWLAGKTWTVGKRAGKFIGKKIGPWGLALCAVGAGWAWYRSDARGWVRVGDTVAGCFL